MSENLKAEVASPETIDFSKMDPKFRDEVMEKLKNIDWTQCLACGMCTAGCPYSDVIKDNDPRKFLRKLVLGMREEALKDPYLWNCNVCERCTVECPMGVNFGIITRGMRGQFGIPTPGFIDKVVNEHIHSGNQMDVPADEYIETIEWIEEELQEELGDPNYKINVGKEGADFIFGLNAREIKYYSHELQEILKVFYYAKADYTLGLHRWDCTNLALFSGKNDDFCEIQRPFFEEAVRLGVKKIVVTECGHAYKSTRLFYEKFWDGPKFPIISILEVYDDWIKDGTLKVDPTKNPDPCTVHDPCNLVRKSGVLEANRNVMKAISTDFREMYPNRQYNYCCGAGGGGMAMPEFKAERLAKAIRKIEQIDATGANVVAIPCHNCIDQFNDMNKDYKKGWKCTHITPLLVNSLILPDWAPKKEEEE